MIYSALLRRKKTNIQTRLTWTDTVEYWTFVWTCVTHFQAKQIQFNTHTYKTIYCYIFYARAHCKTQYNNIIKLKNTHAYGKRLYGWVPCTYTYINCMQFSRIKCTTHQKTMRFIKKFQTPNKFLCENAYFGKYIHCFTQKIIKTTASRPSRETLRFLFCLLKNST